MTMLLLGSSVSNNNNTNTNVRTVCKECQIDDRQWNIRLAGSTTKVAK